MGAYYYQCAALAFQIMLREMYPYLAAPPWFKPCPPV